MRHGCCRQHHTEPDPHISAPFDAECPSRCPSTNHEPHEGSASDGVLSHGQAKPVADSRTNTETDAKAIAFGEIGRDTAALQSAAVSSRIGRSALYRNAFTSPAAFDHDEFFSGRPIAPGKTLWSRCNELTRVERGILTWIIIAILAIFCLTIGGCKVQHESSALNATAQATGEATGKAIILGELLAQVESASPAPVLPLVQAARRAADGVMLSLQSAMAERVKAEAHQRAIQQENENLRADNDRLEHAWFTPVQKRFALYIALAIFLLRGLGLVTDGWLGTIASMAAHGLLAVATFGVSLIVSLGDNAYFRKWFSRKKDDSNPDVGGDAAAEVTQPAAAELATN